MRAAFAPRARAAARRSKTRAPGAGAATRRSEVAVARVAARDAARAGLRGRRRAPPTRPQLRPVRERLRLKALISVRDTVAEPTLWIFMLHGEAPAIAE